MPGDCKAGVGYEYYMAQFGPWHSYVAHILGIDLHTLHAYHCSCLFLFNNGKGLGSPGYAMGRDWGAHLVMQWEGIGVTRLCNGKGLGSPGYAMGRDWGHLVMQWEGIGVTRLCKCFSFGKQKSIHNGR